MIDAKMEEIQKKMANNEEVSGFLSTMLANKTMSMGEIYANISELMAAAVDTVRLSPIKRCQWARFTLTSVS